MKKYRLYDSKDAKELIIDPRWTIVIFLPPIPFLFLFVPKITDALILTMLLIVLWGICFVGAYFKCNHYGRIVMLDGGVLKLYAPGGRKIAEYHLDDMNKAYVVVDHNIRGGLRHKCLLLCKKGLILEGECTKWGEEWLPYVKLYEYSNADKKKMVDIENKELEEKILAYYAEQPIDDQE